MRSGPTTVVLLVLLLAPTRARPQECLLPHGLGIVVSPWQPVAGEEVTVLAAHDEALSEVTFALESDVLRTSFAPHVQGGGPPHWWAARSPAPAAGTYRLVLAAAGQRIGCLPVTITAGPTHRPRSRTAWRDADTWTRGWENLYSAWLAHLFAVPEGTAWPHLHDVTRDATRNLLHNHLHLDEDGPKGLKMRPDCADNPYYLRAYFAWKNSLPFGFFRCTRGSPRNPPACAQWSTNRSARPKGNRVRSFYRFLRSLKTAIHSGSARTPLDQDDSDLYPTSLTPAGLRPGTVFADPFGHTLTLVRRLPPADQSPGLLLAVDAQPDGTVTIKRFWRGNFLFTTDDVIGDPGFKAFRPLAEDHGKLLPRTNHQLAANAPPGAPFSLEQHDLAPLPFYDRVERAINPDPLDPVAAYRWLHEALHEQTLTRVTAVANGEAWMASHRGNTIAMPRGKKIFQTSGPWEDFSTPARDMRMLIAMDTVADFPDKVVRMPQAFRIPPDSTPEQVRTRLQELHQEWATQYEFAYQGSDGSTRRLTMADLFQRLPALEMAYNPNDCIEIRWAEPTDSPALAACKRHAPATQRRAMRKYRPWFHQRRR